MNTHSILALPLVAAMNIAALAAAANPPIGSTFSTGTDGWSALDLNCDNYAQSVGGGTITWFASGGAPGGFIRSTDPTSNCYSYESPLPFEGDKSGYIEGELRWKIRTNVADWLPGSVLILIGGGTTLVADVPQPTTNVWLSYEVSLVNTSFHLNSTAGATPSVVQFQSAMTNLTSIRISAEFGSEAGEETVDLDSVVLVSTCSADLNGDGVVDAQDLAILLGAWGSTSDPASDINYSGLTDATDLAILLGSWGPCR
ncbi:MAG: hypothetical protein JNL80_06545 [Phycisphaerae bacterium]|nr:hypothetical protein [Phycisphaerae bacterium]